MIKDNLGLKYHWAVSDYLQRAARHISSKTDLDQAYAVGKAAVKFALSGENAVMPIIKRTSSNPYSWEIDKVKLSRVANVEKKLPKKFISKDGFGVTEACKNHLRPLIQGEAYPPYKDGVIETASLRNKLVKKKLKTFKV
jgi:6-phosphofructokinase 1